MSTLFCWSASLKEKDRKGEEGRNREQRDEDVNMVTQHCWRWREREKENSVTASFKQRLSGEYSCITMMPLNERFGSDSRAEEWRAFPVTIYEALYYCSSFSASGFVCASILHCGWCQFQAFLLYSRRGKCYCSGVALSWLVNLKNRGLRCKIVFLKGKKQANERDEILSPQFETLIRFVLY